MNQERRRILDMLAEGQITADDAERLFGALEFSPATPSPNDGSSAPAKARPKYLRVLVESGEDDTAVNLRVPIQLLRAGVRLVSLIPAQAR
ncbi:MAG TPA: hypothetical protein V6D47_05015, partial [Oscillatoriaceae cyanobacterium]